MSDRSPDPAEPEPNRRWGWLPLVVIVLCTILVGAALFAADRLGQPTAAGPTADFVPADGTSTYADQRTTGNGGESSVRTVTESAIITGTAVTGSVDWMLGAEIIGAAGRSQLATSRFWRTTTTTIGAFREAPLTRVYRIGADIALLVESGPGIGHRYTPNLVELPANVKPGASWESRGSAGDRLGYAASYHAESAAGGCLNVAGTIRFTGATGSQARQVAKTWCRGQGVTNQAERTDLGRISSSRTAFAAIPRPRTDDLPFTWTPTQWTGKRASSISVDPTFGKADVSGTPSSVPPAMTAGGVLVRTNTSGQDLVGFTPAASTGAPPQWQSRWRAHPGGTVLTLSTYGDVVVATTSGRRMVAYSDEGIRLWELRIAEVVMARPARAAADQLAFVTVGGEVFDVTIATGQVRWHARPGSDIGIPPVVSAGVVVVADRAGNLIGLALADGRERWRAAVTTPELLTANGGQVVVAEQTDLDAFDPTDGDRVWQTGYQGNATALGSFAGWVLLNDGSGVLAADRTGRVLWRRPGTYGFSTDGTSLV